MVEGLSLCIIAKDEEKNISECISSFETLVDKVVVVDTGSDDRTKILASQSGASVFDFEWTGSFSDARNFCISKVQTDWCLFVDADERLEKFDVDLLREMMKSKDAIYVNLKSRNDSIEKLKLWRVDKGYKFVLPVHEFLEIDGSNTDFLESFVIVNNSFIDYDHLIESRKGYIEKLENYLAESKKYLDRVYFYLCADAFFVKDYEKSHRYGQKYLDMNMPESYFLGRVYYYMGELELMNGNPMIAKKYIEKAYEILGESKVLHEVYSHILYTIGDDEGAVKYFKKINE